MESKQSKWGKQITSSVSYMKYIIVHEFFFISEELIAGLLESANSSILVAQRFFKEVVGEKIRILC